jgi:membrane-associated phospholipid phosphatase
MVHMHWIYYVLAGAAVIVLINVLFILYLARSASRDSE